MADSKTSTESLALEPGRDALEALANDALRRVFDHLESLPDQPAADVVGALDLARALIERQAPEGGTPAPELLNLLFERVIPKSFNTAGPGYLAYIPGGGLPSSAIAAFIAQAVNRYVGVFAAAPPLAQLETNVLRWFTQLAGLPTGSGGILTSGGSLAGLSAIVAAREARLPENFLSGILYTSEESHHSIAKAAALAGFPRRNVRVVPADEHFRMRLDALQTAVDEDRRSGLEPFLVVGNAGSTNTGAVDDLLALADFAQRERLWFHADAAYGGFFLLTDRGRRTLAGIERADSIVLDPHKGLFLPYGTGCLLVRDLDTLRRSNGSGGDYLPGMQSDPDFIDSCTISPELSRGYRGLGVWLPIKLHGLAAFRAALDEKLDLAQWATEALRQNPDIEIVAAPQLSLVAFRHRAPGRSKVDREALNRRLLAGLNARQRVHVSGAVVRGEFLLRFCVLSFRTHRKDLAAALEDLDSAIAED